MPKNVITLETEDLLIDGAPHVKRIVKENDAILHEDIVSLKEIEKYTSGLNRFHRWIESLKNPKQIRTNHGNFKKNTDNLNLFESLN